TNVYSFFQTSHSGLHSEEADSRLSHHGPNEVQKEKKRNPLAMFVKAFINPFIGVLTVLVIISFILDVLLAPEGEKDWAAIIIISTMVVLSA
ncbi:magnesium-translocating P-type ATPase, partial [Xanthomonas citri pv. citri]|nr:magnesium-translocating P-type ATPase [Xanthomonas citri pv. citri]